MENNGMQIALWVRIIMVIVCVCAIVLLAAWSIVWEWVTRRTRALSDGVLPAARAWAHVASKNVAKLAHHTNTHLGGRPVHPKKV
jgi:uncharacterized iron-regulated membrane protein